LNDISDNNKDVKESKNELIIKVFSDEEELN
jgi:hypothetical protein